MLCARAMGACVMMRDNDLSDKIPEKFEPCDYHKKRIEDAKKLIGTLEVMNASEIVRYGEAKKVKAIVDCEGYLAKQEAENKRIEDMVKAVTEWTPPTPDHNGLKEFMLEQLEISRNESAWAKNSLDEAKRKPAVAFFSEDFEAARRDIKYNEENHAAEVKRAAARTEWVKQLRASI